MDVPVAIRPDVGVAGEGSRDIPGVVTWRCGADTGETRRGYRSSGGKTGVGAVTGVGAGSRWWVSGEISVWQLWWWWRSHWVLLILPMGCCRPCHPQL